MNNHHQRLTFVGRCLFIQGYYWILSLWGIFMNLLDFIVQTQWAWVAVFLILAVVFTLRKPISGFIDRSTSVRGKALGIEAELSTQVIEKAESISNPGTKAKPITVEDRVLASKLNRRDLGDLVSFVRALSMTRMAVAVVSTNRSDTYTMQSRKQMLQLYSKVIGALIEAASKLGFNDLIKGKLKEIKTGLDEMANSKAPTLIDFANAHVTNVVSTFRAIGDIVDMLIFYYSIEVPNPQLDEADLSDAQSPDK